MPSWTLSAAATRSHQVLQEQLSELGISGYECRCLLVLAASGPLSQAALGTASVLDPGDVTHTVRSLEDRGWVSRVQDPAHGRRILVSLTAAGRTGARRASTRMAEIQQKIFVRLSARERATLMALLKRVG